MIPFLYINIFIQLVCIVSVQGWMLHRNHPTKNSIIKYLHSSPPLNYANLILTAHSNPDIDSQIAFRRIFFKVETTDLPTDAKEVYIYELAALDTLSGKVFQKICSFDAATNLSEYTRSVLDKRNIKKEDIVQSVSFSSVWSEFLAWTNDLISVNREIPLLIAYNGKEFDYRILKSQLQEMGLELPLNFMYIDPYVHISKKLFPFLTDTIQSLQQLPSRKLIEIHHHLLGYHAEKPYVALESVYLLKHTLEELEKRYLALKGEPIPYYVFTKDTLSKENIFLLLEQRHSSKIDTETPEREQPIPESEPMKDQPHISSVDVDMEKEEEMLARPEVSGTGETEAMNTSNLAVEKIYLNVPFSKKDLVKSKGGKFDWDRKQWFVPKGVAIDPFEEFIP